MGQDFSRPSAKRKTYSGTGARAITLGTALSKPSTAIHCNSSGEAICHFLDGSKATLIFAEGGCYDYQIRLAVTAGGTDPDLVAIF